MKFPLKLDKSLFAQVQQLLLTLTAWYPLATLDDFRQQINLRALVLRIQAKMISHKMQVKNKKISVPVDLNEYIALKSLLARFHNEISANPYFIPFLHEVNEQLGKKFMQEHHCFKAGASRQVAGVSRQ